MFVCLFVCSSTISRQPAGRFTPKFACRRTLVPDVSSPLLGVGGPRRAEKGTNEIFVTMGVNGEFLHFGGFSAISQQRLHGSTPNIICVGTMSADVPPAPVVPIGPWRAGGGGVKYSKNWGVVSFVHRTATISIFLSDAKCSPICRAQNCAHSGLEPSRSAKAFLQGGPKSSKKFRIFHHLESLRPYISETINNRGI